MGSLKRIIVGESPSEKPPSRTHLPRILLRLSLLALIIFFFALANLIATLVTRDLNRQRRRVQRLTRFWIRVTLRLMGITISLHNGERIGEGGGRLIVANHISTLDVLALYAVHAATFVTSVEVGSDGLAGFLSKVGGAIFIERRSIKYLRREIATVADLLEEGFDVAIFPEGTTTNGSGPLLPFKTAFFAAAAQKNAPILPIAIRYLSVNGAPADAAAVERAAYYGDMTFTTHLRRLLSLKSIEVRLTVLEPVMAAEHHRDVLGALLRERIQAARDE